MHKGYSVVVVRINGVYKFLRAHRLIATAFIPNPLNLPQVHHIDENKKNNAVSNLMWVDNKQNLKEHAIKNQFPILQYTIDGVFIKKYEHFYSASENTGINIDSIRKCALGKQKIAGGFVFLKDKPQEGEFDNIGRGKYMVAKQTIDGDIIEIYKSASLAAHKNNIKIDRIHDCINGKQKTSAGFKWVKII